MSDQIWIYGEDFVSVGIGPFANMDTAIEHMEWCRAANMGVAGTVYRIQLSKPEVNYKYLTPDQSRKEMFEMVIEGFRVGRGE
jgi:hypothetical protein